ncbi:MAG: phage holin family protein [Candidatus Tyrphobacter sp.]
MIHILRFIVNAIALFCIAHFGAQLGFDSSVTWRDAGVVALIFGIVNALIGPFLRLISWPINFLTHGIFSFVINYILFIITVALAPKFAPSFTLTGVKPWWYSDLCGAIVLMVVGTILREIWRHPSESKAARATA